MISWRFSLQVKSLIIQPTLQSLIRTLGYSKPTSSNDVVRISQIKMISQRFSLQVKSLIIQPPLESLNKTLALKAKQPPSTKYIQILRRSSNLFTNSSHYFGLFIWNWNDQRFPSPPSTRWFRESICHPLVKLPISLQSKRVEAIQTLQIKYVIIQHWSYNYELYKLNMLVIQDLSGSLGPQWRNQQSLASLLFMKKMIL